MVSCMGELHIWTLKNQTIIPDNDIGCHTYHDKGETVSTQDQPYYDEKLQYTEERDITWTPKNRRPDRLRDTLKEVEDLLVTSKCIYSKWKTRRLLMLILTNGTVIQFAVSPYSGDVEKIFIDKSLVGKLSSDVITDALTTDTCFVFSYVDKAKLDYVSFGKKLPVGDTVKKFEKLSAFELKIGQIDLPGPIGRRLERKLSVNANQDLVLVWWPTASEEAWPWSPMTSDRDRANVVVLGINGPRLDILGFTRTECDPIYAGFSCNHPYKLFTIEQVPSGTGELTVEACTYEITRNKIHKTAPVASIPLKNGVISHGRNPSEDKLLLGCDDGTLVMHDGTRRVTQVVQADLIPSVLAWHPSGTVVCVGSTKGEVQIFDLALNPLLFQLIAEEPSPTKLLEVGAYFRSPPSLKKLDWCPEEGQTADMVTDATNTLFMVFDRGPLAVLQFCLGVINPTSLTPTQLINQYIKHRQIEEAVNLLNNLDWNTEGQTCLTCLQSVVDHLLRQPLNPAREGHLETALGSFYAPTRPLTEATVLEYRDPISRYARRFFHHLLRHSRFEKAFLLAVDIGSRDLFMDIHYLAQDKGEIALADVARKKADSIDAESIGTGTDTGESVDEEDFPSSPREAEYTSHLHGSYIDSLMQREQRRHHVPQQVQVSGGMLQPVPRPGPQHQYSTTANSIPAYSYEDDHMLNSELYREYAQAFGMENEGTDDEENVDGDESSSTVKVIHFGLV